MQEMSSRNVFFAKKNSLEFLFEGDKLFVWESFLIPVVC